MHYIFRQDDWCTWAIITYNKIYKTINSCGTHEDLSVVKEMINNFIFITALEEEVNEKELEDIVRLFWFRLELQYQLISETKSKELV